MEGPKEVMIHVVGGIADIITCPSGITVTVRDYDCDGCQEDKTKDVTDENGDHYHEYKQGE